MEITSNLQRSTIEAMTADNDKTKPSSPAANKAQEPVDVLRTPKSPDRLAADAEKPKVADPGSDKPLGTDKSVSSATSKTTNATPGASRTSGTAASASESKHSGKPNGKPATVQMSTAAWILLAALVLVGFLSLALWWQHQRFESVAMEVASRLQSSDERVARLQLDAQRALSLVKSQSDTVSQLQRDVRGMRSEMTSIDQAFQSMNRGLDDRILLNDVRRLLNMAEQQLVFMGNVKTAISVLETAQSMLEAQLDQDRFAPLLKAIGTDLERLRSAPEISITALSAKLDRLVALVNNAPLLVPDTVVPHLKPLHAVKPLAGSAPGQPEQATQNEAPSAQVWWARWIERSQQAGQVVAQVFSREFSDLMQVRRAQDPSALLLSDEQAMVLRANVRSMLLSAQLALLSHQNSIWTAELTEVASLLNTHYDVQDTDTRAALGLVAQLLASPVSVEVGSITASLSALALASQSIALPAASGESR